jgi:hypothetical protein
VIRVHVRRIRLNPSCPAQVPGINVFLRSAREDVDGRDKPDKPGHDDVVIFVSLFMFR